MPDILKIAKLLLSLVMHSNFWANDHKIKFAYVLIHVYLSSSHI